MFGEQPTPITSRRWFLGAAAGAALGGLAGLTPAAAATGGERHLHLHNRALGEDLRVVYFAEGRYLPDAAKEVRRIFRDKHNEKEIEIDGKLLDILWSVQRRLCPGGQLEIVCGYRSPETNAMLRRRSRAVAKNSFHMYGRAVDLRIADCSLSTLHNLARRLQAGGVGYYPRSNFVHLDTGPVRHWAQLGRA
jgi:uncharacterized protein YcbK (DUF882 family)